MNIKGLTFIMLIIKTGSALRCALVRYSLEICELSGVINHKTSDFISKVKNFVRGKPKPSVWVVFGCVNVYCI